MSPPLAWPLLYQCKEGNGAMVFTDSTAQLQHCLVINAAPATRLSYPVGVAAAPLVVPEAPEPPSVADQSDLVVEPAPDPPAEDDVLPGSQSQPPCVAGINPLNPFRGPGCVPTENTVTIQPDVPPEPESEGSPP
ncbi:MAG: hypothetical protein ACREIL_09965 [Nitrospiraceae bacterium]